MVEVRLRAMSASPGDSNPAPSARQRELFGPPRHPREALPGFARGPAAAPRRGWRAAWAIGGLSLLLGAQIALSEWPHLAADAGWRPWLVRLCERLECELPPWRETAALRIIAREVRPHPSVPGALLISASFRNDAAFAQPWPQLELVLSDLDGHGVAGRRFAPIQYLGQAPASESIEPGQSAAITLELHDPGPNAVAFSFEFF